MFNFFKKYFFEPSCWFAPTSWCLSFPPISPGFAVNMRHPRLQSSPFSLSSPLSLSSFCLFSLLSLSLSPFLLSFCLSLSLSPLSFPRYCVPQLTYGGSPFLMFLCAEKTHFFQPPKTTQFLFHFKNPLYFFHEFFALQKLFRTFFTFIKLNFSGK